MKKIVSAIIIIAMLSAFCLTANAEASAQVTVTISNGTIGMSQEITVTDADNDGSITINDALILAHDAAFEGGANAGYAASSSAYGLSITKLWGVENGGGYGYYLNDNMAMGLTDSVSSGDRVYAYVYTDTDFYSDAYSFFDKTSAAVKSGESVELTLSASGYDASWNTVIKPVAEAVILINGEETELLTDENGKVTVNFDKDGEYLISAVSDTLTLVPPVCKVTVASETNAVPNTTVNQTTAATVPSTDEAPVDTGATSSAAAIFAAVAALGFVVLCRKKK